MCDDAYSRQEIMAKERDMIETVDYDVGYPLSYRFLRRFGRVSLNHMFISSVLFKAHHYTMLSPFILTTPYFSTG